MYRREELSECELMIMKCVWDANKPISCYEIMEQLRIKYGLEYKDTTVYTFLSNLKKKGFVKSFRKGVTFYEPARDMEEFRDTQIEKMEEFWGIEIEDASSGKDRNKIKPVKNTFNNQLGHSEADIRHIQKAVDYLVSLEGKLQHGLLCNFPIKVGDKVQLDLQCKQILRNMNSSDGALSCPFSEECNYECDCDNHTQTFIGTVECIMNEGYGWYFTIKESTELYSMESVGVTIKVIREE
jgi:predicted transcriptional regulator